MFFVKKIRAIIGSVRRSKLLEILAALGQGFGFYLLQLHAVFQKLWSATDVHHAVQAGSKSDRKVCDPYAEGAVQASPPLRDMATHASRFIGD